MRRRGLVPAMPADDHALAAAAAVPSAAGRGRATGATTMIARARMRNIRDCVQKVIYDHVPGDLIETGVWRGGACIYMRGILAAHNEVRGIWLADSFEGLPEPAHPADEVFRSLHDAKVWAVSKDEVRANFARYGLLDESVHFIEGVFRDTLPTLNRQWAVIRLDGDMYDSTMDGLQNLYSGLSPGGFLIVDDYGAFDACKQAVDDFRREHAIAEPIQQIDESGVFWRRR